MIDTKDAFNIKKYSLLNDLFLKQGPSYGKKLDSFLKQNDSILNTENQKQLQTVINDFEKRKIQDSLSISVAELNNKKLTIKNQRYWLAIALLTSALSFLLVGFLWKLYKKIMDVNEELIFQKSELSKINASLQSKIAVKEFQHVESDKPKQIQVRGHDKIYNIDIKDISHVMAEDNGVRVYLTEKSIWSDLKLKDIIEILDVNQFIRIFRSTVVNIEKIEWVNHSSLKLKDGTELKIGRTFKKNLTEKISGQ